MKKRTLFIIGAAILGLIALTCIACLALGALIPSEPGTIEEPTAAPIPEEPAIEEPTATPEPIVEEWEGVYLGMSADDVLALHPKSEATGDPVVLGKDSEGSIVRWSYPGAYLIFALRTGADNVTCYRVIEIQLR